MTERILVIEDEKKMQEILYEFLHEYGYDVDCASDGITGLNYFHNHEYDLVLLDVMLPKIDGFAVLELIRKESLVPVIMLTALEEEDKQMKSFDLCADDYITKPFSINLLIRRVQAVLRRVNSNRNQDNGNSNILSYKNVTINCESCVVLVNGKDESFTYKEFELIKILMENPKRVYTREELLNKIWGYDFIGDEKVVNGHIKNIRKKLGMDFIETIRGRGYKLNEKDGKSDNF